MEEILYYHSRVDDDPLKRGKRMTVCCLVDNNKMVFGMAKINNKDVFVKAIGREVALGRARKSPIWIDEAPISDDPKGLPGLTRRVFVEKAKKLVSMYLRSDKELLLFRGAPKKKITPMKVVERKIKDAIRSAYVRFASETSIHKPAYAQPTALELHPQ